MKHYAILISIILMACSKPKTVEYTPTKEVKDTSILEVVWKQNMLIKGDDFTSAYSHQPVVYKDKVLMKNSLDGKFWMLDGSTGEILWQWNAFIGSSGTLRSLNNHIYENNFVYSTGPEVGVINLDNGSLLWQYRHPGADVYPRISLINGEIYIKRNSNNFLSEWVILQKSSVFQKKWEQVLYLHEGNLDGYTPAIEGPALWMSPHGDSVLVFQNRQWHFPNADGKIDFMAYNTKTKEYNFVLEDIEPNGNSNVMPPLVDGDRAYMLGGRQLHCIDLLQGKMLWQQQFLGQFHHVMISNCVIYNQMIIVKADDDALLCYDKYTGDPIWELYDVGSDPSDMILVDGIAYYTAGGKIYAIDVALGKVIWAEESPDEKGRFNNGVGVDPIQGHVYVQDHRNYYCFKTPKRM